MNANPRLLVIEDDANFRKTLINALTKKGYTVTGAGSGAEALAAANKAVFDLIISDVRLPGAEDGIEVVGRIKQLPGHEKAKVLIITGYADTEAPIRAIKLGVADYIYKPFEIKSLLQKVKSCLDTIRKTKEKSINVTLRKKTRKHLKRLKEVEKHLLNYPDDWGKYQKEFNQSLNEIFNEILEYEKANISKREAKIRKIKSFFIKNYREIFLKGDYIVWSLKKPYGYAGDFRIIDDIYINNPQNKGIDRLFDNYFQMSSICTAVRNRKEDFKNMLIEKIKTQQPKKVHVMNLASGPCREIKELLLENPDVQDRINFDCYDTEEEAHKHAKKQLKGFKQINYRLENALRIAGTKDITRKIKKKYDVIYSMGLFDYLKYKLSVRLLENLKKLLKKDGIIIIADVRDRFYNPSVHFMEWVGDWNLIYRSDEEFRQIFMDAGFKEKDLKTTYEQQGIIQYIIGKNA
jgi:DNA-binding response OmpR family regulator/SAM-dependent methyltransferase